ncbi:uncharacterized protein LOC126320388 isoform X2 [Schistocerca gregaria]|nr:uncharacterized protein LOC126320388 isoform X2 [Schistocerca gregaria]
MPDDAGSITLKYVRGQQDTLNPLVLTFPQGPPPTNLLNNTSGGLRFSCYHGKPQGSDGEQTFFDVRAGANEFQVEYFGSNREKGEQSDSQSLLRPESKYLVGVYNKLTNTVELLETPSLFLMQQRVITYKEKVEHDKYGELTSKTQRDLLIHTFSSNRRQRQLINTLANQVDKNAEFGVKALDIKCTDDNNEGPPENRSDLPPHNSKTHDVKEIYPVDSFISMDILDFIIASQQPCIKTLEKNDPHLQNSVCMFVFEAMQDVKNILISDKYRSGENKPPLEQAQRIAALLQYLDYLITIYKLQQRDKRKLILNRFERLIPTTITNGILKKFAVQETPTRWKVSKSLKLKLISYICVIAITVKNFSMDIAPLAKELSMSVFDLRLHLTAIGCSISTNAKKSQSTSPNTTAVLKAPLKLPDQTRKIPKFSKSR